MRKIISLIMASMCLLYNIPNLLMTARAESTELISITEMNDDYFRQTISMYEELENEFCDPQISGYTDEEFFGVYDGSEWTTPSLLNYEKFSALFAVEQAAMNGDYETAKAEIQNYYRKKYAGTSLSKGKNVTTQIMNSSVLLLENVQCNSAVGILKLTREPQTFEVNLRDAVLETKTTDLKRLGLIFGGIRKDGNLGILYSKESENIPILNVTVNGRTRQYTPTMDTYVSPGKNQMDNYGDESVILISESYSSIGSPLPSKSDLYTNQGYMMFDLSDLQPNDSVSNAVLEISGFASLSNCPQKPESVPDFTDIYVAITSNVNYQENTLTWASYSGGGKSVNGEYCIPLATSLNINSLSSDPLIMYNATGEEAYAYAATRLITGAMRNFLIDEFDYTTHNTLENSQFISDFMWILGDLSQFPTHIMTPDKFTLILKYIHATTQHAADKGWTSSEEGSNWGVVNACAVAIAAMVLPEFDVVDDELIPSASLSLPGRVTGGWREVGNYRIYYTAKESMVDDGSCTDNSFAYTMYIVNQYNRFFNIANALDINVSEILSKETLDVFGEYIRFMMRLSNPARGGWGYGDGEIDYFTSNVISSYRNIIRALDDSELSWFIGLGSEDDRPDICSYVYDSGRKASLKSSWDKSAIGAFINADGNVFAHSHNDDLALNVHAYGKMLLADPTQPNYDTNQPVTNMLYSTRGHNTIEINGVNANGPGKNMTFTNADGEQETITEGSGSMNPGSLHPENREFNKIYNFLQAQSFGYVGNPSLDENYEQFREVLMVSPEYIIVTDRITPDGTDGEDDANTYKWFWHTVPDANLILNNETGIARSYFDVGANITIVPVEGETPINASKHVGWFGTENSYADFVRYDKIVPGATTFNTVLYPTPEGVSVELSTHNLSVGLTESEASAFSFDAFNKQTGANTNVHYYSLHNLAKKEQRTFGEYATDAELSLVQKTGENYEKVVLRNGTRICTKEGNNIVESKSPISELGILWNADELILESSRAFVNKSYAEMIRETENLSLGKGGISSLHFDEARVEYAFDGNIDTAWSAAVPEGDNDLPWIALDLETEQEISKIIVKDNLGEVKYTISYLSQNGEWIKINPTREFSDPLADSERPVKTYFFEPVMTRYIKIQADRSINLQIYEMGVYSSLANSISLYDLKIYAPGNIRDVVVNGESVPVHKDGNYVVFSEELSGNTPSVDTGGSSGDSDDRVHGSGPSPGVNSGGGSGGGGGSSEKEDEPEKEEPKPETPEVDITVKYPDIETLWAKDEIISLSEKGIISGYEDGTFKPDNRITRAEFLALATRLIDSEERADVDFNDVSSSDWYYDIVRKGVALGIISMDTSFRPNDLISREEMCKIVSGVSGKMGILEGDIKEIYFEDKDDISPWAEIYVSKMATSGIIKGNDRGEFLPKGKTTRAEAATVIYRILNVDAE